MRRAESPWETPVGCDVGSKFDRDEETRERNSRNFSRSLRVRVRKDVLENFIRRDITLTFALSLSIT